jgi:hypothetical protein
MSRRFQRRPARKKQQDNNFPREPASDNTLVASFERIVRLHDLVECPLMRGVYGWYTQDYARRSIGRRKEKWYGIGTDPSPQLSPDFFKECQQLCRQYLRSTHIHYPFISLAVLKGMVGSLLRKKQPDTRSDVIVLLIVALASITGRTKPLPVPQVAPFEGWTSDEITVATRKNIEAIPGLKYYILALSVSHTMTVDQNNISDQLQEVQKLLLIALYAEQLLLLPVRNTNVHQACQICILLLKR